MYLPSSQKEDRQYYCNQEHNKTACPKNGYCDDVSFVHNCMYQISRA